MCTLGSVYTCCRATKSTSSERACQFENTRQLRSHAPRLTCGRMGGSGSKLANLFASKKVRDGRRRVLTALCAVPACALARPAVLAARRLPAPARAAKQRAMFLLVLGRRDGRCLRALSAHSRSGLSRLLRPHMHSWYDHRRSGVALRAGEHTPPPRHSSCISLPPYQCPLKDAWTVCAREKLDGGQSRRTRDFTF